MTVSEQIIQVFDALCTKFGLVIDWSSENIIPYVSTLFAKLVSYEIWTSVAWIVFSLMIAIADVVVLKKTWPKHHNDEDYAIPALMFTILMPTAIIATILIQTMDIIKCITFPEMFVYEYVMNFIETSHG
jgi:hypothetical protein